MPDAVLCVLIPLSTFSFPSFWSNVLKQDSCSPCARESGTVTDLVPSEYSPAPHVPWLRLDRAEHTTACVVRLSLWSPGTPGSASGRLFCGQKEVVFFPCPSGWAHGPHSSTCVLFSHTRGLWGQDFLGVCSFPVSVEIQVSFWPLLSLLSLVSCAVRAAFSSTPLPLPALQCPRGT